MELTKVIQIITALADGVNPQTGEVFLDNSPYEHPETIRALFTAISMLNAHQGNTRSEDNGNIEDEEIELTPQQEAIYEQLRQWRSKKAHEEKIPSFMILHNSHLKGLIVALPISSIDDLLTIKGFGGKRTLKYGEEILKIVTESIGVET